ncbi:hypothetical protein LJC44_07105 [Parabacteroides sp. OttesenSCG-928-G06]|nr:hypothetical protein [Parabacteroides sp. OttesenSCG-928-K15]MDL2282845.1 hypothetical protein [Parabacteroides sp. OttesenSCG-928-G06]
MNGNLNMKRVGLILRMDWISIKEQIIFVVILISCLMIALWNGSKDDQLGVFWLGFTITLLLYQAYVDMKIHDPKGMWLTLPASMLEKYVALLVAGMACVGVYLFIFWLALGLIHLLNDIPLYSMKVLSEPTKGFGFITFHFAYFLLATVTIRKNGLGKAFVAELLILGGLVYMFVPLMGSYWQVEHSGSVFEMFEVFLSLLGDHANTILYLFAAFLFYIAFVQLKKQQR